jgi:hypothetical protein
MVSRTMAFRPIADGAGCVVNHSRQGEILGADPEPLTFQAVTEVMNYANREYPYSSIINAASAGKQSALAEPRELSRARSILSEFRYNIEGPRSAETPRCARRSIARQYHWREHWRRVQSNAGIVKLSPAS